MSVWKQVRNVLLTGICATSLLWPHEAEAARPYDNKRTSRQTKRTQRRTQKQSWQRNRKNTPQKETTIRLNAKNPQKTLNALIQNLQKNDTISSEYKQIIITSLTELSKTQTGRYIFSNIPDNINFRVWDNTHGGGPAATYTVGQKKVNFPNTSLDQILKASSDLEKQEKLLRFTSTIAHELTHATQEYLQLLDCQNASSENKAILQKFNEMSAYLEGQCAEVELLRLPSFAEVKNKRSQTGELDVFLKRAQDLQIKAGMSPEKARRFARTESARSFWTNTPSTPIRIGTEVLYASFVGPTQGTSDAWSSSYDALSFNNIFRHEDIRHGTDIRPQLAKNLKAMGVDLTPEFIIKKKSFSFEQKRLVGYVDGIRQLEVDALGKNGRIVKHFVQDKMWAIVFQPNNKKDSYTNYFPDGKTLRSTYTITDIKGSGIYREYNTRGQQIIEAPIKNGNASGSGWILENNKKVMVRFNGGCVSGRSFSPHTSDYWRRQYLKANQKQH